MKVKQLEWKEDSLKNGYPQRLAALMPCGSGYYSVTGSAKDDEWQWFRNGYYPAGVNSKAVFTLEEAQMRAQRDYESRIMAALDIEAP
jgi:hypothetical protein